MPCANIHLSKYKTIEKRKLLFLTRYLFSNTSENFEFVFIFIAAAFFTFEKKFSQPELYVFLTNEADTEYWIKKGL